MKNLEAFLETLERLEKQAHMAQELVKTSGLVKSTRLNISESTPRTFEVGDFIVTDKQWTKCDCKTITNQ